MSTESDGGRNHDADDGHETDDSGCHEPRECEDCDPDLIDDLACQAAGIQAQATYNTQTQADLKAASDAYAKARGDYRTKRAAATLEVQDLRHQAKQLVERIRCQIKQERVIECLDEAYRHICERLRACGVGGGCPCDGSCEFDKSCPDDYHELVRRLAEYNNRLEREKKCFNDLVGEADALVARVAAAKKEIDDITAALAGDPATVDLKKQYVAALVAQRHLVWDMIWNGFRHTRDYIDCLCRALTCWTKANDAISVLTGCKAVLDCRKQARDKCCEDLRTKTVEEILLEYERLCGGERCKDDDGPHGDHDGDGDDGDGDADGDDDDDDDPPCGCDHGHEHRRSHHHHHHRHDYAA